MKLLIALTLTITSLTANAERIVLSHKNTVSIREKVTSRSMYRAKMKLSRLVRKRAGKKYPIYLVLDTPGGSVDAGLSFVEYSKHFKNVHTITLFAASMGAYISQAMPGKRYTTRISTMMFHRAYVSNFGGQVVDGEFESRYKLMRQLITQADIDVASRVGLPLKQYRKKAKNEWWIYGARMVREKVADKVVNVVCTPDLVFSTKLKEKKTMFGKIKYRQSACPTL